MADARNGNARRRNAKGGRGGNKSVRMGAKGHLGGTDEAKEETGRVGGRKVAQFVTTMAA